MTDAAGSPPNDDLLNDPLLRDAPVVEGFKVLDPAVLYGKIGKGGMGAVYRGRHFKLDLDVAVKCLKPSLVAEDGDFVKRFEREARLAASITHQNVVRVMDVQEKNGLHYLVMEFVRGETAAERVARKGPLAEKEALAILIGACAGLAEAHQRGIVHRDIKPSNIMISLEGRVKLADLGLAKSSGSVDGRSVSVLTSVIMGTPQYMPPEQWESTDVTAAADVWALGATLFFLLAGREGIPGGSPLQVARRIQGNDYPTLRAERSDVRAEVHELLERCVRTDPKDRYPDAKALLKALRRLAPEDEDALLDPDTGSGVLRAGTVTPPPRETLLRIRAKVETNPTARGSEPTGAAQTAASDGAPTRPAARIPELSVPARRAPWVMALLALLLAAGGGIAWSMGAFGNGENAAAKAEPEKPTPPAPLPAGKDAKAEAKAALARGMQALPKADQLDAAIDDFEQALALDPTLGEAKAQLALAFGTKAKKAAAANDPDAAYTFVKRGLEHQPGDGALVAQADEIARVLAQRLRSGLAIHEPKANALVGQRITVSGKAESPLLKSLRVAAIPTGVAKDEFPPDSAAVQVVAGEFTAEVEVGGDGEWSLFVEGEDDHGIKAIAEPVRVVVDTKEPGVLIASPGAGVTVAATFEVRGRVVDATPCRITVNGAEADTSTPGEWKCSVTMRDGPQQIVVAATDRAGHTSKVTQAVRVDATPPDLVVEALPSFTNEGEVAIRGTVKGLDGGKLTVGVLPVEVAANGAFAAKVALPKDDAYSFVLTAVDGVGNKKLERVEVRRHTVAPVLEWSGPEDGKPVPAGEVEVTGIVRSDLSDTKVTVNGVDAIVNGASWSATVRVEVGKDLQVVVAATDAARNQATALRKTLKAGSMFSARIGTDFEVVAGGGTGVDGLPKRIVHKATRIVFVLIPPGTFQMGSPPGEADRRDDEVRHKVKITQSFYMAETEVSIGQWRGFVQATGHKTDAETSGLGGYTHQFNAENKGEYVRVKEAIWSNPLPYWKTKGTFEPDANHPVTQVSWNDAMAFCTHYRLSLPTEAEWEYACRAGRDTRFWWGDREEDGLGKGNYADKGGEGRAINFRKRFEFDDGFQFTAPVTRSVTANDFGLKDTTGNVWEWCADFADVTDGKVVTDTYRGDTTDPLCVSGSRRVFRGGGWGGEPALCRSASRGCDEPASASIFLGFRPVLSPRSPVK